VREPDVFLLAQRCLTAVIERIGDEQWATEVPPSFPMGDPERRTALRDVLNHQAYDDAWIPNLLAGRTMDEVGRDAWSGDLLGDDPKGSLARIAAAAGEAARGVDDLDATVHCSFGDCSTREYFWQLNLARGIVAHDLARALGVDDPLTYELAEALLEELGPVAEEWRAMGLLYPRVEVPGDASARDRFLALAGRRP
jgi:uncharacterized protein (TIGR03086 family)